MYNVVKEETIIIIQYLYILSLLFTFYNSLTDRELFGEVHSKQF